MRSTIAILQFGEPRFGCFAKSIRAFFLFALISLTTSSVAAQSPVSQSPAFERIGVQMVRAFKLSSPMHPFNALAAPVEGEEKEIIKDGQTRLLQAAMTNMGERQLTGQAGAQVLIAYMAWLRSRRPVTAEKVVTYESRLKMIDRATIDVWQAAEAKSGTPGNSRLLTVAAIAFHDFLFQGAEWKDGNPTQALARLASLTPDAVTRWKAAVKGNSYEEHPFAAWALIAVDGLFVADKFNVDAFDAALPAAQKMLNTR